MMYSSYGNNDRQSWRNALWASLGFGHSTIDDLLSKDNCSVEMLLDDPDCIS